MNLAEKLKRVSEGELAVKPIEEGEKILLVDGLNTYLRAFSATPTMNDDGSHVGGISGFLLSLGASIRMFKPKRVVIVFDGKGGSQRRRALFSGYKSNRRNMTKLNRTYDFKTLEEEKAAMKWQLLLLIEMLRCLPLTVMAPENVEADDAIAYIAQTVEQRGENSIIVSTDKDFLQLISDRISVWNPIKKKMYTPEKVVEDYGFHPNNFVLYRAVTGDKSDCIPGIAGIKEATLLKYFPILAEEKKINLDQLIEIANSHVNGKKKPPVALTNLLTGMDILELNLALMRLDSQMAMGTVSRLDVLEMYEQDPYEYDKLELTKLIRLNKLISAFGNYETWLQTTFVPLLRYKLK